MFHVAPGAKAFPVCFQKYSTEVDALFECVQTRHNAIHHVSGQCVVRLRSIECEGGKLSVIHNLCQNTTTCGRRAALTDRNKWQPARCCHAKESPHVVYLIAPQSTRSRPLRPPVPVSKLVRAKARTTQTPQATSD
mmetsp:Transcript_135423/g.191628  ORF Transcript_135423/g.191628 Transcript_135423/m.191628 type:complete len:136 (-) Transcript_135423:99-506(-)